MKLYLIGSLRNPAVPVLAQKIRGLGIDCFDDWMAAGPEADDKWRDYEKARGRTYAEAMQGHAAKHVFEYDRGHLDSSDCGVLLLPAGKSGHLELGYLIGQGKPCYIVMPEGDAERWDVMYGFATKVFYSEGELLNHLWDAVSTIHMDTAFKMRS